MSDGNNNRADDNVSDNWPNLSRRRLLALTAGTTAGLAGCTGDSGGSDGGATPTTTQSGFDMGDGATTQQDSTATSSSGKTKNRHFTGEPVDGTLNSAWGRAFNPNDYNANIFVDDPNALWRWRDGNWFIRGAGRAYKDNTVLVPLVALKDVTMKNGTCVQEWTLRDDDTWWDGTDVTTRDIKTQHLLNLYQTYGPDLYEESKDSPAYTGRQLEIIDEKTLRWKYPRPKHDYLAKLDASYTIEVKHDYWKDYLERYQEATTKEDTDAITKELIENKTVSMEEFRDEGLGNGLWKPSKWDEISMTWTKHEDHPRSDWTNLKKWHWRMMPDNQKQIQAYKQDQFDVGGPGEILDELEDIERFRTMNIDGGRVIAFNFRTQHTGRRAFRRAIAYLIDWKELSRVVERTQGFLNNPPLRQTAMNRPPSYTWLGRDWMNNNLVDYGMTAQPEKAAEVLKQGGYTKEGDVWVGPDSEPTKGIRYLSRSGGIQKTLTQYVSGKMDTFGLKPEVMFENSAGFSKTFNETGEFDIVDTWQRAAHPSAAYVKTWGQYGLDHFYPLLDSEKPMPESGCQTMTFDPPKLSGDTGEVYGQPIRPTFPKEAGTTSLEVEGEGQTLYPIKWKWDTTHTNDNEKIRELARKQSWYVNWQLPKIELYHEVWPQIGDTTNFYWGDGKTDEQYIRDVEVLPRGHVEGRPSPDAKPDQ